MATTSALLEAARSVGVADRVPALQAYVTSFARWNQRINLSAARTNDEITDHVVDCLALVPHVPGTARVVDVGSGGGLPGVVLAAARPDLRVTCVEPIHKKAAFLRQAARDLSLTLTVLTQRADSLERAFDVAVSRATFDLRTWLDLGLGLVVPGGLVLAMEGLERSDLPPDAQRHTYSFRDRARAIIVRRAPLQ
jgi:16S rRNA (guanine527-N7)-methyltransferase